MATYFERYHGFFNCFEEDLQAILQDIVANSSMTGAEKARVVGETVAGVLGLSVEATHRQVADNMACAKNTAEIAQINTATAIAKSQSKKDLEVKSAQIEYTYAQISDMRGRLAIAKAQSRKDLELKSAQIEKIYSDIALNKEEIALRRAQVALAYAQLEIAREEIKLKKAQIVLAYAQVDLAYAQIAIEKEKLRLIPAQVKLTTAQAGLTTRQTTALDDAKLRDGAKIISESLAIIKSAGNNAGALWDTQAKAINKFYGSAIASQTTDPAP